MYFTTTTLINKSIYRIKDYRDLISKENISRNDIIKEIERYVDLFHKESRKDERKERLFLNLIFKELKQDISQVSNISLKCILKGLIYLSEEVISTANDVKSTAEAYFL